MDSSHRREYLFTKKILQTPPSPPNSLNLSKFIKSTFVSSFLDFASVSVHRTSLSLCGLLLRIPHSGCLRTTFEATFCIQPTQYAVQSGRVRQHFARMTIFGCGIYSRQSFIHDNFYMLSIFWPYGPHGPYGQKDLARRAKSV